MQAKFRRLMGIKGDGSSSTGDQEGPAQPAQSEKLMADLEAEFERSRAFQLSRGAGGKSGIGLGYSGTQHKYNRSLSQFELYGSFPVMVGNLKGFVFIFTVRLEGVKLTNVMNKSLVT